ncbi:MAG: hypothetical protein LBI92_03095 [Azoarcus sp.]|jgi:hypothetical protein|nr:hypothetical protein [Azoarcus sp.]
MSKKDKARKKAKKATCPACGYADPNAQSSGLFGNAGTWLRKHPSEQFLLGALLGAAAVYVLSHEELRTKILKGGVELYSSVAGGLAELREQVADLKAEVDAEPLADDFTA